MGIYNYSEPFSIMTSGMIIFAGISCLTLPSGICVSYASKNSLDKFRLQLVQKICLTKSYQDPAGQYIYRSQERLEKKSKNK